MATTKQYSFKLKEVTEALIQSAGITEGKWMLGFSFNFGGGNVGDKPESTFPSAIVQVAELILTRQPDNVEMLSYIVDAAAGKAEADPPAPGAAKQAPKKGRSSD
jgi:hypothetical protein